MLTRCPSCTTTFRVTPEQLKARQGRVRCGQCQTVFNALETLVEEPATAAVPPAAPAEVVAPAAAPIAAETAPIVVPALVPAAEPAPAPSAAHLASPSPASPPSPPPVAVSPAPTFLAEAETAPAPVPAASPAAPARRGRCRTRNPGRLRACVRHPARRGTAAPRLALGARHIVRPAGPGLAGHPITTASTSPCSCPKPKPALIAVCELAGCDLPLPRKVDLVAIESSDLHPDTANAARLQLVATLKNRAPFAQEYPHLELTLTDTSDKALLRRVIAPAEYLPKPAHAEPAGFAAGSDLAISLTLEVKDLAPVGYRLYVFYP